MEEQTDNNPKKRRILVLLITIPACVLLACFIFMCLLSSAIARDKQPTLGMISRWTDLKFPLGSKLVDSKATVNFGDCHLLAKIEMDRSQVDAFTRSLPKSRMTRRCDVMRVSAHEDSLPWWEPFPARKYKDIFIHRDEDRGGFREWRMLIRLDDPHTAVLYLEFFED